MKSLYTLIFIITGITYAQACDFCNCYLGLDPGYNKNTIGIRVNWRQSEWTPLALNNKITHDTPGAANGSGEVLKESYITSELFVKYSPVSKLRLIGSLPFTINTLSYDEKKYTRSAISDLTILALYQVLNTASVDSVSARHRLFAGGGIKFPTGKSEGAADVEVPMAHHLYSGTGSTDYLLNLSYIGKYRKLGWNVDVSYKINSESATHYRYGNTFNATPRVFYQVGISKIKLYPHVGAAYETGARDEYYDIEQIETEGEVLWGSAGADVYLGAFSLTTDLRMPVYHDLGAQVSEDKSWLFTSLNFHF